MSKIWQHEHRLLEDEKQREGQGHLLKDGAQMATLEKRGDYWLTLLLQDLQILLHRKAIHQNLKGCATRYHVVWYQQIFPRLSPIVG